MPSLVAFGRRWNISSDDFVFPEISEALFRLGWIAVTLALFAFHNPFGCHSLEWLTYLALLILWNGVTIMLCLAIAWKSSRGSILETHCRKGVVTLIYVRVPLFIGEVVFTVFSIIFAFSTADTDETCFSRGALQITIALQLFLILSVLLGVIIVFNPLGDHAVERSAMTEHRYWNSRLKICKIMQNSEMREAIDEIASLLAAFFADTDFVFSDVVAGLLLLAHSPEQKPNPYQIVHPDINELASWMVLPGSLNVAARMMDFVVAVYGWPTYMFNNCACGAWMRLYRQMRCCGGNTVRDATIIDDNCCSCNTAAFCLEAGLEETDLHFICFRNRIYQVPFIVLTDHRTSSIVVTIRGTLTVLDMVTDLSLSEDLFSVDVDSDPILREDHGLDSEGRVHVHRGMLNSARYVLNTLKKYRVLENLTELHPNYQLVVCGHSLGGGVASLLTLLLKQTYPEVRCYAFSPPGCVISQHGIAEMQSHVMSIIVGDDLVPRISYQSLMHLRHDIQEQFYSTNRAKYEILIKGIFKLLFKAPWDLHSESTPSIRSSRRLIETGESYGTQTDAERGGLMPANHSPLENRIRLFAPGRLLHIHPNDSNAPIEVNWIDPDYLAEIQLTGAIIRDHMQYRVRRIIKQVRDERCST